MRDKEFPMPSCTYGLNCDKCGDYFSSKEAFPKPQLCHKCSSQQSPEYQRLREQIAQTIAKSYAYYGYLVPMMPKVADQILSMLEKEGALAANFAKVIKKEE